MGWGGVGWGGVGWGGVGDGVEGGKVQCQRKTRQRAGLGREGQKHMPARISAYRGGGGCVSGLR